MTEIKLPSFEKRWVDKTKDDKVGILNPNMTLWNLIYEYNKNGMDDIAINFIDSKLSYEEFFCKIDEVAKSFSKAGVKSGDVIPMIMATVPEAAYCLYALNKLGATVCVIDPRLNESRILNDISGTNSDVLVTLKNASRALKNLKNVSDINTLVMLSALNSVNNSALRKLFDIKDYFNGNRNLSGSISWKRFIDDGKSEQAITDTYISNNPAVIIFTGGTTGVHKGVLLSNEALNSTVLEHRFLIDGVERGEKFLDILPPFIAYGLTSLHLSFSYGLETILNPVPIPSQFAKQINDSKASIAFGGPIHWEALANSKDLSKYDFSNLKFPVSGGEKLAKETAKIIDKALLSQGCNVGIYDGYGLSEFCGVFSLYQPNKNSRGTVGYPLRYNDMCIINPETKEELTYNQHGEICIYGPSLMNGYYKNESENEKVLFVDSFGRTWLRTGDLGYINEIGELIITGRSKRIFVCGVNKVYPPELEELIMSFKEVRKCVVTGVDDPELRTVPKVHIILSENVDDIEYLYERIGSLIEEKIGKESLPKYYQVDQEFLYTGSGKIDYIAMAEADNAMHCIDEKLKNLRKK